jgi:hypothetical protein
MRRPCPRASRKQRELRIDPPEEKGSAGYV